MSRPAQIPPSGFGVAICGMSLGYADAGALANRLRTGREPVHGFATFHTDGDRSTDKVN